jgi:hypothetical protein
MLHASTFAQIEQTAKERAGTVQDGRSEGKLAHE